MRVQRDNYLKGNKSAHLGRSCGIQCSWADFKFGIRRSKNDRYAKRPIEAAVESRPYQSASDAHRSATGKALPAPGQHQRRVQA